MRDIIEYQLIAFESCLYQAAIHREELLRNFYRVGRRAIARTEPAAFLIPATQRDPGAARKLLETLEFGGVEIGRAADGSHAISMAQPYSSFAKALLERQNYPDMRQYPGGPPVRPYDVTAHTLPLLMGVDVEALTAVAVAALTIDAGRLLFAQRAHHHHGDAAAGVAVDERAVGSRSPRHRPG